jgi:hypothetical protein
MQHITCCCQTHDWRTVACRNDQVRIGHSCEARRRRRVSEAHPSIDGITRSQAGACRQEATRRISENNSTQLGHFGSVLNRATPVLKLLRSIYRSVCPPVQLVKCLRYRSTVLVSSRSKMVPRRICLGNYLSKSSTSRWSYRLMVVL